jgi:hypothetical protein
LINHRVTGFVPGDVVNKARLAQRVGNDGLLPMVQFRVFCKASMPTGVSDALRATYRTQVLAEKDRAASLIALKDVVEAGGGVGTLYSRRS